MALEDIALAHYRRSSLTTRLTVAAILAIWRSTGPSGFRDQLLRAAGIVAAGQFVQAIQAASYMLALADEFGMAAPQATLLPRSIAGVAMDGRSLTDVLGYPTNRAWTMLDAGADLATADTSGAASLTRIVANEVTQAGITAESVGMVGQPEMAGYVRVLTAPSCGRCAVLAGKWFKWNAGFARHPGCDCKHVPAPEARDAKAMRTNPRAYFDSLSAKDQDHYFGTAEAAAIRGGADLTRTVNATTRKGSRSGLSVPRSIDRMVANKTREQAIEVLTRSGYLAA